MHWKMIVLVAVLLSTVHSGKLGPETADRTSPWADLLENVLDDVSQFVKQVVKDSYHAGKIT